MLRQAIRKYLGLDALEFQQRCILNEMQDNKILLHLAVNNRAVGRLIAKLDPSFAADEFDPARKAASDAIGNQVIDKLLAEHVASNRGKFE